jgi:hypothetical protein
MALFARIALAVLLVPLVFLLPEVEPHRLAASQAHDLFAEPVAGRPQTFGELVLYGPHAYDRTADTLRFALAGVRMEGVDLASPAHLDLRRAIVRGLRSSAAEMEGTTGERGLELLVPGEDSPVVRGASFLGSVEDGALVLVYSPLEGQPVTMSKPSRPRDRRPLLLPVLAVSLAILYRRPLLALLCGVVAAAVVVEWFVFVEDYRPRHAWVVGGVLLVLVLALHGRPAREAAVVSGGIEGTGGSGATADRRNRATALLGKIGAAIGLLLAFLFARDWVGDRGYRGPDVVLVVNTLVNALIWGGGGMAVGSLLGWIVDRITKPEKAP